MRWNRCVLSLYIALILFGEGALLSGGWNRCVFVSKCWWVLAIAPSDDKFALQRRNRPQVLLGGRAAQEWPHQAAHGRFCQAANQP